MKNQIIVFHHLLNNYSGSAVVLARVIKAYRDAGYETHLFTSRGKGSLSDISELHYHYTNYQWSPIKAITLLRFLWVQLTVFFSMFQFINRQAVVYINNLLPFGAAMSGWMMRKRVIYHLHESNVKPVPFKSFLLGMAKKCAHDILFVSRHLQKALPELNWVRSHIIYNALSTTFIRKAESFRYTKRAPENRFHLLMLAPLERKKGVYEFIELAKQLPLLQFELVLSVDQEVIRKTFVNQSLPQNLKVYPAQRNVHPFYQRAHLLMNLSHPSHCVESFGMTVLEGLTYGVPAIVPPVGGIAELIRDGYNGFHLDMRKPEVIEEIIDCLSKDEDYFNNLRSNALVSSGHFEPENFNHFLLQVMNLPKKQPTTTEASVILKKVPQFRV